mmetsp:Transcript_11486/g.20314  ORF Transcript_11486/g.20314 Transcript_11486/m.20314 type:complete len:773 (-) Transcript_11486:115-2433(-)
MPTKLPASTASLVFVFWFFGRCANADPQYCTSGSLLQVASESKTVRDWLDINVSSNTDPSISTNITGVTENGNDDAAILSGLITNSVVVLSCIGVFMILRERYPLVFSNNAVKGIVEQPPDTSFGWITATFDMGTSNMAQTTGLDVAMLIEFCNLCVRILGMISLPLLCILAPLNALVGNVKDDIISKLGIGNVPVGHPWMYYIYGLFTVAVCYIVTSNVYAAQSAFLERRYVWLKTLPKPRRNTIMVRNIPDGYQHAGEVKSFFERIFPKSVKEVHMVMHCDKLEGLVATRKDYAAKKNYAERLWETKQVRKTVRPSILESSVDSIDYYTKEIQDLNVQILAEQSHFAKNAHIQGGIHSDSAFVTFKDERTTVIVRHLHYTRDTDEWTIGAAPSVSSLIWSNLRKETLWERAEQGIGYTATLAVFMMFVPFVAITADFTSQLDMGPLDPLWKSVAPSLGLTIFLSFLPTVLLLIADTFFNSKSEPERQHDLQITYFWFQLVFVVLVVCLDGGDFLEFVKKVIETPIEVPGIMASTMPAATHFYINFMLIQWVAQGMYLTRMVPLSKYISFKALFTEEEAKEMSEPEDQDFYGLGAKSATFTILMVVCIVFGTMQPVLPLLGCVNFLLSKLAHGYLAIYAETRKPDLGGEFWVSSLKHMLFGTIVYTVLMSGLLYSRSDSIIPTLFASCAGFYVARAYLTFDEHFQWQFLPIVEAEASVTQILHRRGSANSLEQPVSLEDPLEQSYQQFELFYDPLVDTPRTAPLTGRSSSK